MKAASWFAFASWKDKAKESSERRGKEQKEEKSFFPRTFAVKFQ